MHKAFIAAAKICPTVETAGQITDSSLRIKTVQATLQMAF